MSESRRSSLFGLTEAEATLLVRTWMAYCRRYDGRSPITFRYFARQFAAVYQWGIDC